MSDQTGNEHKQGDLAQEILNRIVSDADFRQQLLDNPAETLAQAGYTGSDDVSGYAFTFGSTLGAKLEATRYLGCPPVSTGVDCAGGGKPTTTAMNCGGGGGGGGVSTTICDPIPQPKKPPNS